MVTSISERYQLLKGSQEQEHITGEALSLPARLPYQALGV
jgi:hypothetical protein